METISYISFTLVLVAAALSVFYAPFRVAALVIVVSHFLNAILLLGLEYENLNNGLWLYLCLATLDLLVMILMLGFYAKLKQKILLDMAKISALFIVVNLGCSWSWLINEGNIFYYNYSFMIITLNIYQASKFWKSGRKGLKDVFNGIYLFLYSSRNFSGVVIDGERLPQRRKKSP